MILDLFHEIFPWIIALAVIFFIWLIVQNKNRLYKIRNSGRISEIVDRRRNIVLYIIAIIALIIGLLAEVYFY